MFMNSRVESENRIIVITGATSGIGRSIAHEFVNNGDIVVALGRNENDGSSLEFELKQVNKNSMYIKCDVSNFDDISHARDKVIKDFSKIDVLINNAGIMNDSKEISELLIDDWVNLFRVNLNGVFFLTKVFINDLIKSKGSIINNASIAGMHSYVAGQSYAYSSSKAAVIQFTRQIAFNYAKYGVRANCICPGIIDTKILGSRDKSAYEKRVPLGYIAKPIEVAKVVKFLCSNDARYITGVVLPIDGGVSL